MHASLFLNASPQKKIMSTLEFIAKNTPFSSLKKFKFVSVSKKSDEVIESYSDNYLTYKFIIPMKDEKRHGLAKFVNPFSKVIMEFTFVEGSITGPCKVCNDKRNVIFIGSLKDGKKDGVCTEYNDDGEEIFEGAYVDDIKYPFFEEVKKKRGFYIERSKEDYHIISYTQYDPKTKKKYGKSFILDDEDDEIIKKETKITKYGETIVVREFDDDVMIEYNRGRKVYEGEFSGDWKNGYTRNGNGKEYEQDVLVYEGEFIKGRRKANLDLTVKSSIDGYYEERTEDGKVWSCSQMNSLTMMKSGRSIIYSLSDGKPISEQWYDEGVFTYERVRVEGNIMVECDEDENELYRGEFFFQNTCFMRWGKGIKYDEPGVLEYVGEFVNGYFHGPGVMYKNNCVYFDGYWEYGFPEGEGKLLDGKGDVVHSGVWHVGYLNEIDYTTGLSKDCSCGIPREVIREDRMSKSSIWSICHGLLLPHTTTIEEFIIGDNMYNNECKDIPNMQMNFTQLNRLKRIEIGSNSFKNVWRLIIEDLPELQTINIGENCFRASRGDLNDGICQITNCRYLKQLKIGDNSFEYYKGFDITLVKYLQTVEFGKSSFKYADFSFRGREYRKMNFVK